MAKAKTVIGFINTTIKGYVLIFGVASSNRVNMIINSILFADVVMTANEELKVIEYCKKEYNYNPNK